MPRITTTRSQLQKDVSKKKKGFTQSTPSRPFAKSPFRQVAKSTE